MSKSDREGNPLGISTPHLLHPNSFSHKVDPQPYPLPAKIEILAYPDTDSECGLSTLLFISAPFGAAPR